MPRLAILALTLAATCALQPAEAAQSYDNCTGFIESLPATITRQGTWCLRKDLSTSITSGAAITITANNATIDCNDYKIGGLGAGSASQASGISAVDRQNATIRHCNVRGFYSGIDLLGGAGHLVEDNRLDNNLRYGIHVIGDNGRVRRNAVYDTGGAAGVSTVTGIYAYADIVDNDVQGVFAETTPSWPTGIVAFGYVASGNRVAGLVPNVTGGGYAMGITGFINKTSVVGNQVTAGTFQVQGTGINSAAICANNTVGGFSTAYNGCATSSGNLP